jgi:hypothetical protein
MHEVATLKSLVMGGLGDMKVTEHSPRLSEAVEQLQLSQSSGGCSDLGAGHRFHALADERSNGTLYPLPMVNRRLPQPSKDLDQHSEGRRRIAV